MVDSIVRLAIGIHEEMELHGAQCHGVDGQFALAQEGHQFHVNGEGIDDGKGFAAR